MKPLIFVILILPVLNSAQLDTTVKVLIKTSLLQYLPSLIDNTGAINIEVEKPNKNFSAYSFGASFFYSYGPSQKDLLIPFSQEKTTGMLVSVERRRYFNRHKVFQPLCLIIWPLVFQLHSEKYKHAGLYSAVKFSYKQINIKIEQEARQNLTLISKHNPSLVLALGFQSISKRKVVFDQSLAVGLQYSYCKSDKSFDPSIISLWYYERHKNIFPVIEYKIKVGFCR
jgi:hypothetical protein